MFDVETIDDSQNQFIRQKHTKSLKTENTKENSYRERRSGFLLKKTFFIKKNKIFLTKNQ
jgi:hypothetical protein